MSGTFQARKKGREYRTKGKRWREYETEGGTVTKREEQREKKSVGERISYKGGKGERGREYETKRGIVFKARRAKGEKIRWEGREI